MQKDINTERENILTDAIEAYLSTRGGIKPEYIKSCAEDIFDIIKFNDMDKEEFDKLVKNTEKFESIFRGRHISTTLASLKKIRNFPNIQGKLKSALYDSIADILLPSKTNNEEFDELYKNGTINNLFWDFANKHIFEIREQNKANNLPVYVG